MKGQEITPWTFLNQNIETEQTQGSYNLSNKSNNCRLPKLSKVSQTKRKQQQFILAFKKRVQYDNAQTLNLSEDYNNKQLLQRHKDVASSLSVVLNKKAQHSQAKDDSNLTKQGDSLAFLCQMRLLTKFIYSSLAIGSLQSPVLKQQAIQVHNESLGLQANKISAINILNKEQTMESNRIHNREAQLKMSAIREMLKRDREGLNILKKKLIGKKNEQLQLLKNKLISHH